MQCSKQPSVVIWLINTGIVFISFLVVGWLFSNGWKFSLWPINWFDLLTTLLLAGFYAYFYNKISRSWRLVSKRGFWQTDEQDGANFCGLNGQNFLNGLTFGLLVGVIVFLAMTLAGIMISTLYVYVLEGIRGIPPPFSGSSLSGPTQIIVASVFVEMAGKTEDQPPR